ncbi:hypothetical protein ACFWP7_38320 [Streptomyces sp. NPDC058470]|uniref:hypothetical protein n=1 Tax=Streptomyces sp. NPDC058470 TaxID=3346515 RepID=UPI003669C7C2
MSLPWAARGLKIRYVVRNDWQSRGLAMAAALACYKKIATLRVDPHAVRCASPSGQCRGGAAPLCKHVLNGEVYSASSWWAAQT